MGSLSIVIGAALATPASCAEQSGAVVREVSQLREVVCAENNRDFADGSTFGTIPQEATPPF
jgi:hypothetical protein